MVKYIAITKEKPVKTTGLKLLALAAAINLSWAGEPDFDGYSYMAIGLNNVKYNEKVTTQSGTYVDSDATTTDIYYMTGGLVRLNDRYDFSYDLASTLYPNDLDENVYIDGVHQTNKADILLNNMTLLLHYKLNGSHRVVGGVEYQLNTFKRFDFLSSPNQGVVEERSASLALDCGYWYESSTAAIDGMRTTVKALVGLPVWQKTTNTSLTAVNFYDKQGYNAHLSLWLNYTVLTGMEIGFGFGFDYVYRKGGGPKVAMIDGTARNIYWPENTTRTFYGALSIVWNFR